jgi:eukaryotic-like serine/threonine-protein kinase
VAKGRIKQADLDEFLRSQAKPPTNDLALGQGLVDSSKLKAEDLIQTFAELTGIPWISDEKLLAGVSPDAAKAMTLEQAEKWTVVPIRLVDRHLHVAMRNPRDVELVDKLRFASGVNHITGVFATDYGIRRAIARLYHGQQGFFDVQDQFDSGGDPFAGAGAGFSDKFTRTREKQFDTSDLSDAVEGLEPARGERASGPLSLPAPGDFDLPPPGSDVDLPPPPSAPILNPARSGQTQAMPSAPVMPEVGDTFAGRYQLLEMIGEGGSASVFRAQDKELDEPVALKLFRPMGQAESEDVIARFKLELSLSRLLSHPNIVRLFDLGLAAGWRYLTMELLEGTDLNTTLINHGKPIGLKQGLGWMEQVCAGLKAAHERGVIHRDIKPHNLFLTNDGTVKVMDFGIAKKMHSPGVTVAGMVRGTPEFISPEQINNFSAVTHLTDLYALGATAYTIFTGQPPFVYDELTKLLYAQANTPPLPPRVKNPELPEALDALILRMLEKNPAARPQSAGEVEALFRAIREGLPG